MENNRAPLLSVCLITYNHASFIRHAIEGVLMQQVNFDWEFIIADDCSTDDTRAIVLEYAEKYPILIKPLLQEKNVGAAKNWLDLLGAAKGNYIAYFEGDDYWIDPCKLQKQVDYLELNPSVSLCFHPVMGKEANITLPNTTKIPVDRPIFSLNDILNINIIPTCSVVYRNLFTIPDWFEKLPIGDIGLYFLCSKFGSFGLLPETMAVYRLKSGGLWTSLSKLEQYQKLYAFMAILYEYANKKERREIKKSMKRSISHIMAIKYPSNKISRNFLKGLWYVRKNLFFLE